MTHTDIGTTHPLGMKLIFLDIDGCLNSARYAREQALLRPLRPTSGWLRRTAREIDPAAVALLNEIVERSGARIVLSSSWRINHDLKHVMRCLRKRGYTGRGFLGSTPILPGKTRGEEVDAWLADNYPKPEAYVILDDGNDFRWDQPLVQTTYNEGLTALNAFVAAGILGVTRP